jgi:HAD superfamily hydrolase (TIGR01490 family)
MSASPQVGAFFDLDGTLLRRPSLERRFVVHLLRHGEVTSARAASWFGHFCKAVWRDPRSAISKNKGYLAGLPESLAVNWLNSRGEGSLEVCPEGLSQIAWHLAEKHEVFIVSGGLAPLARGLAQAISPRIEVVATELQVLNGFWTGQLAGEHMSGEAKRSAILTLAAQRGLQLELSYAYGNETADLPMLECVGHPFVVNPGMSLRRIAAKRDWLMCNWARQKESHAERAHCLAARESR